MIQVLIKTSQGFLNVIAVYAPLECREGDSEEFYNLLQNILETRPKLDMILVLGVLNARVGNNKIAKCVGRHGKNIYNRNEEKLIDFIVITSLIL
jgi:hypothetical protein